MGKSTKEPVCGGIKKPHRWRPGTVALREIRKYQKSTDLLIPKSPFVKFVREVTQNVTAQSDLRYSASAILALQGASEDFLVEALDTWNTHANESGRKTVAARDVKAVAAIRAKFRRGRDGFTSWVKV